VVRVFLVVDPLPETSPTSRHLPGTDTPAPARERLLKQGLGGAWTLDRLWERLVIGAAIRRATEGRRLGGEQVERVIFALVAQQACEPGSKNSFQNDGEPAVADQCAGQL
jgi:hypothetical protein